MKSLKQLLIQLNEINIFEGEENKGWKYKSNEPAQQTRTRAVSAKVRQEQDAAAKEARRKAVSAKAAEAKEKEGKASKWGIPYISDLAKRDGKVVEVSVEGHENDGMLAWHSGNKEWHFKHPNGKYHTGVELDKSGNGIAVKPKPKPGQKVIKPIAFLPPSKNALASETHSMGGKIERDSK